MRIGKLEIKNFRSLKNCIISFNSLAVLVGRNNSGKSSTLHALRIFFTPKAPISIEDYYNNNVEEPIEISVEFENFTNKEADEFSSYISDNKLIVRKIITWQETSGPDEEYFSYLNQIPQFSTIRQIQGAVDRRRAYTILVESAELPDLSGRPSNARELDELMERYENEHPELKIPIQTKGTFFGARNVGGGILDKYTQFIFLPAVKDATEEISGSRSSIQQLLNMIVFEKLNNRQDLVEFRDDIAMQIVQRFSPENLGELVSLSSEISATLNRYSPGSSFKLEWDKAEPPQISIPTVSSSIVEDNFESDVTRKGHGLQRAVILTLLEYFAFIISQRTRTNESDEDFRFDTILAIEEPELYLHPSRCRYFASLLYQLSERGLRERVSNSQIIYTTHSPYFVGLDRFDDIKVYRKHSTPDFPVPITKINSFSLQDASTKFIEVCGPTYRKPEENFRIRSIPVMTTIMNEGFFADLAVIVEGQSDIGVLWKLQHIMGMNWDKHSISLLPSNGKGGILKAKIIFDGLNITNYITFDKDSHNDRENRRILNLLNYDNTKEFPNQKIHDNWAYNIYNMEDELINILSKDVYEKIWEKIEDELDCDDSRIRKNPEMTARFTEIVYEMGLCLPHFEKIVEKINMLYMTI